MDEDISKAWAGIGTIKASVSGLERKITTYRNSQRNTGDVPRSMFDDLEQSSSRNITAHTVPRRIVEAPDTHSDQMTSSPVRSGVRTTADVMFSDSESVSTIPSRPIRDRKDVEEGMIKLKQRILKQKESSLKLLQKGTKEKSPEQQVRFLDPNEYNVASYREPPNPTQQVTVRDIVRKRKKATAPAFETYSGFSEAQKPVKKPSAFNNEALTTAKKATAKSVQIRPASPHVTKEPAQRKVALGADSKKSIITTSSWRQGAALTRKVLGNKTQETVSSQSTTSESNSSRKDSEAPKNITSSQPTKVARKPIKSPAKVPRKPKKIEKPPVEEPPKVKARHYNPTDVQQYIEQTRKQRKQQLLSEKKQQIAAEKEKEKRLQELFEFQKKAVKRGRPQSAPSPQQLFETAKTFTESIPSHRASSSESSDKENTVSGQSSARSIPLLPNLLQGSKEIDVVEQDAAETDNDTVVDEEEEAQDNALSNLKDVNLLETYMQPENTSVTSAQLYSQQRQRMDAIRQTALALRQKIHEETNRLTVEASKATYVAGRAPQKSTSSPESLPGATNVREAWIDHSTDTTRTQSRVSDVSKNVSDVDFREYQATTPLVQRDTTPTPPPERYQYPMVADPYSIINVYSRKREQEEKRMAVERKAREEAEEREMREREDALRKLQEEREIEQERLEELEQQLLEDKAAITMMEDKRLQQHRPQSSSTQRSDLSTTRRSDPSTTHRSSDPPTSVRRSLTLKSDVSAVSDEETSGRHTESLLRSSISSEGSAPDSYHFTPDKTEDISIVSPASARKTLSFSEENDSPAARVPTNTMHESESFYSPGALHRKLRGELARYDTFSTGLEHVTNLEHTQQFTEAQHDTIAMARAMKREKGEHATEMSELQEKLKQDMLVFQEKLQQVQQQSMLNKAETLAKEAEIKAKSAEAALQATHQIAQSQESANKELINMAQHILKSHAKKQDLSSPDTKFEKSGDETPYTPSETTLELSRSNVQDVHGTTETQYEAESPLQSSLNNTIEHERSSPTKSYMETEIPEDISGAVSPDKDIATEISGDTPSPTTRSTSSPVTEIGTEPPASPDTKPVTSDPLTPVTEPVSEPESPETELGSPVGSGGGLEDTPGRDADGETSPEKAHESFRAVLPSESHRRRMSASEDSVVSGPIRKDSFAEFTLEQVRQYMKNEKLRAKHQQTLLDLRDEAVKERTEAKLQWLDIKKRRIQRKGADEKMPPLIKQEQKILEKLAIEQEEIQKLAAVQRAAQEERRRMLRQQREITMMQERTAALRRKIEYAEEHPTDDADEGVSDTDVSEYTRRFSEYDTDVSSVYDVEDPRIRDLTDFNDKIQKEGREVQRLLDLALSEKHETEKIEQEFGISSPSRLPRGITPLDDTGSTIKGDSLEDTIKESPRVASTPRREVVFPVSPSLSVIDPDQNNTEVVEMEQRVQSLKEELRKKKSEAKKLLKSQQFKKKEALKQQEIRLRKQIQTVTDVIEKQKTQISTKLRQQSPSRSDRDSPTKRSVIRSISSKSDVSLSPDSSRIISVTSSISDKDVSDRQEDGSISESIERSTKSVSESLRKVSRAQEKKTAPKGSSVSPVLSSKKKDDTSNSISEDLSKYSEPSYHKLLPSAAELGSPVHFSLPGESPKSRGDSSKSSKSRGDSSKSSKSRGESSKSSKTGGIENIRSLGGLEDDEISVGSEKAGIYSLREVDEIGDDEAPYHESPQPSLHLDVKEVMEDLSISSGSSINDGTDISIGSYKNLPSSQKPESVRVSSRKKDDTISEDISEDISEILSSEKSLEISAKSAQRSSSSNKQLSTKSESSHKSISEKLAALNLGGDSASQSKVTSRAPVKNSYTLSFDESDDEDIRSLLSNIDESLSKSADIMSAAKTSPGLMNLELDVDGLTPVMPADEEEKESEPKTPTLGGEVLRTRSMSGEGDKTPEKSHGLFSNLTELSSPTPASSTGTGSTTKQVDPIGALSPQDSNVSPSTSPHRPSPPQGERSPSNKRSQSLRQSSLKAPSVPASSLIEEELSEVDDKTDMDLDEISHDESIEVVSANVPRTSQPKSNASDVSLSASKTMSELKDLISEPSKRFRSSSGSTTTIQDILSQKISDEDDKTISDKSDSTPQGADDAVSSESDRDVTQSSHHDDVITSPDIVATTAPRANAEGLSQELTDELLKVALQKMLRVRHTKTQRELTLSPKYTERSPTSPEQLSPRGESGLFNDTFRDTELESALSLARSCTTAEDRPTVLTPDDPPPSKITVQNTAESTREIASAATRHLVACVRDRRPVSIETLHLDTLFPDDFTPEERRQGRTYNDLILSTTLECFLQVTSEYKLDPGREKEELPPWKAAARRQPRPHWMRGLPSKVTLGSTEEVLPDLVVTILGLGEKCKPRQYHNMENILAQGIRDEEAEWTDYDSDELVVKFRIADSIFENLLRETVAVCAAIESRY